jgi:hypothetical protein
MDITAVFKMQNYTSILLAALIICTIILSLKVNFLLLKNIDIVTFSNALGNESNLYLHRFGDDLSLGAPDPIPSSSVSGDLQYSVSKIYNMYGKYIYEKALQVGVSPSNAAAVIFVESKGDGFGPDNKMTIRFEACDFYNFWGKYHKKEFNDHFYCSKDTIENIDDKYRNSSNEQFINYHDNHYREWNAFQIARNLNETSALNSISMGLSQVMGFNYHKLGYNSVKEMFDKLSSSVKAQIDSFFSSTTYKDNNDKLSCLDNLKTDDYIAFAGCYNGSGHDKEYGSTVKSIANVYKEITKGRQYPG